MWWFNNFVVFIIFQTSLRISSSEAWDDDHECLRSCADEALSKKICRYKFFVGELLGGATSIYNGSKIQDESVIRDKIMSTTSFLGINGKSPGPRIEVCLGDTIEVVLYNKLGSAELSFHWHGLRQKNSTHMDGVPMVTQCSILPFGGFQYKLKPESVGSYLYYAHMVSQQADGVYGSLTVRGLQDDPTLERILLLSSRSPTPLSRYLHLHPPTPSELLLNGQKSGTILKVDHGARYLLRLVNANAYNCPVVLSISDHEFRVLAVDGNKIQPTTGRHIVSFPGERFDITIEANQPPGKYLIDIRGLQDCQNLRQEAFILYDGIKSEPATINDEGLLKIEDYMKTRIANNGYDCHTISKNLLCALDLKGSKGTEINANQIIYIPFDINAFPFLTDGMSDYRYHFYGCPFYPSSLSQNKKGAKVGQINGMSFKYPTSPLLSQPENTPEELICSLGKRSTQCTDTPLFCECIQIIEVPPMKNIDIVLIDEGFGGNDSHTFHIHGYNASILGRNSFQQPITKDEIMLLDRNKRLHRNFVNPPQKDSFVVPNKGYVILRLFTDNLGYWLWEARSTAISPGIPVMQFLLKVGQRQSFLAVPLNFPTCGSNKHPDMVFETN
ncbi:PREDICTED: laccase-4-like [Habropoda laboriosa]|uniref:laccase-4-like n=1 Tax=Habropoda laboriosa TaxID=597456 RepID=UPI00083D9119|nr:PREDICTED: laccase-4-like [Habropoda laboriosa]